MKTVNTVELKNHANQLLRHVRTGKPVVVTHHGRPTAALIPLTEDSLEEFIIAYSPAFRRLIAEAETDVRAGRIVRWKIPAAERSLLKLAEPSFDFWENADDAIYDTL